MNQDAAQEEGCEIHVGMRDEFPKTILKVFATRESTGMLEGRDAKDVAKRDVEL